MMRRKRVICPTPHVRSQLENVLKNLETGGKKKRDLNADGGRIGFKNGKLSMTPDAIKQRRYREKNGTSDKKGTPKGLLSDFFPTFLEVVGNTPY